MSPALFPRAFPPFPGVHESSFSDPQDVARRRNVVSPDFPHITLDGAGDLRRFQTLERSCLWNISGTCVGRVAFTRRNLVILAAISDQLMKMETGNSV